MIWIVAIIIVLALIITCILKDVPFLSDEERAKEFVRPVDRTYVHTTCGTVTTMAQAIAETYARDPKFYGATYCVYCKQHLPVGEKGEFVWDGRAMRGRKVGT